MMTRTFTILTATLLTGTSALALTMTEMDANGDGALSIDEFLTAYPSLSAEEFSVSDVNGDTFIDADEHAAAVSSGVLPPDQG